MAFLVLLFVCIAICGISLYAYVNKHNALTMVRMRVPIVAKELALVEEENVRLHEPLNAAAGARKSGAAESRAPLVPAKRAPR